MRRRGKLQDAPAQEAEPEELSDTRSIPPSAVNSVSAHTAVETLRSRSSRITARSPNFENLVLRPRKILIDQGKIEGNTNPYNHFGTEKPPDGKWIEYKALEGFEVAEVWLSLSRESIEEIIEEYDFMASKQVCEQEYASFATETFLRRQRRSRQNPTDRKWRAERMLQLVAPPAGRLNWDPPITFDQNTDEFKFDVRPDCSYWLSLAGFNPDYRSELENAVYVHEDWITCPYFTIEFKKHGQSVNQAEWQAAAAASVALYNRYVLKTNALGIENRAWTDKDKIQMRHYILTFVGAQYGIWILRASLENDRWDGCSMRRLCSSRCTAIAGVQKLERWINEIHRWGLGDHAAGCQVDVKTVLQFNDVDISAMDIAS
ncbi:hypothetical protein CC80DRAFT_421473 [Byssothecium circinans]|uniref:Uncharacterized protein n=1 Tax=Byssothecium circinans TaxID=147558 RepID=A0A6A5TJ06_9PLEO|nr:hypothetical protein CC80DRAFT_421473 [Byssothecium circinans]